MRLLETTGFRRAFPIVVTFTLLAGDAWRYSIGWWGFGAIAVVIVAFSIMLLVHYRATWRASRLPYPLIAFVGLATLSLAWSFYPGATALGLLTTVMTIVIGIAFAIAFSWDEILRALGTSLRLIMGLSLLFELVVSIVVRAPVLPVVAAPGVSYSTYTKIPELLYWSRDQLFTVYDGGKIQGIVGNSSLLAFAAFLAIIVFGIQFANKTTNRPLTAFWLLTAVANLLFTRSATITLGLVAAAIVLAALLLVRRARTPGARTATYWSMAGVLVAAGGLAVVFRNPLLALLGKSEDLTGRVGIWQTVIGLAQQRPIQGWGWVSYWVPWVSPFDHLVFRNGVRQLHAHNAWIDIWFQLGIIGLIVFGALVLSTTFRSWTFATDRPQTAPGLPGRYTAVTFLPLLVVVALVVQSLAESRLLVEYGMFLLTLIAVKSKRSPEYDLLLAAKPAPGGVRG